MYENRLLLNPKSVALFLGTISIILVLASISTQLAFYITGNDFYNSSMLYLDAEFNIPTLFSTFILFCASLLLTTITSLERNQGNADVSYWAVLAFGFLYLAVDETIQIHEKFGIPLKKLLNNQHFGIFHHFWIIPGVAIVLILGLFFLKFFFRLPKKTRLNFFISAFLYIGGTIGIENIGGYYTDLYGLNNLGYSMIATLEESLEMAGAILFIWSLLIYISEKYKEVRFQIEVHTELK
jgi:hypothetical protein